MGIRGLAHLLQPYRTAAELSLHPGAGDQKGQKLDRVNTLPKVEASRDYLGEKAAESDPSHDSCAVVLDGPALAYHAYYIALSRRGGESENALDAMPTYSEVQRVALGILRLLKEHGLRIGAIFFDGALPEGKRDVRMERLTSYLHQLENFRATHRSSSSSSNPSSMRKAFDVGMDDLISPLPCPAKLKSLPAAPFLVPAVIEALQHSCYSDVTRVVPGEADVFCAAYANLHGGATIITSDSDLLVYDIGPDSSVLLWRDIELHKTAAGSNLKMMRFETVGIAKRLGLESILPLAYAVDEDPHKTITKYTERAKQVQEHPTNEYAEFAARYAVDVNIIQDIDTSTPPVMRYLDPRVSEWILGGPNDLSSQPLLHAARQVLRQASDCMKTPLYLPVLIEDTTRSSAWDVGTDIRTMAYSLLRPSSISTYSTNETMRRGSRITETPVTHPDASSLERVLEQLLQRLNTFPDVPQSLRWPFHAVYLVCQHAQDGGKQLPSRSMLKTLLLRRRHLHVEWVFVHWSAQVQTAAYSLRMLKQCCTVALASPSQYVDNEVLEDCAMALQTMPSLAGWFDEDTSIEEAELDRAVDVLFEALGVEERTTQIVASSKKRKKKRQAKDGPAGKKSTILDEQRNASSNMFDLLLSTDA